MNPQNFLDSCLNPSENFPDEESFIQAALRWHFSLETGSEFWLEQEKSLGFNPRRDVRCFSDLKKFPDISPQLRFARAETLIPRGLKHLRPLVFESGGTTGRPKFFIYYQEWLARQAAFLLHELDLPRGDFLLAAPGGPHVVSFIGRECADFLGGLCFAIDMDPRFVRACLSAGQEKTAERYIEHLLAQIEATAAAQNIRYMMTTPPLLRALVKNAAALEKLRPNLRLIMLCGAEVNLDETQLIAETLLPDCAFFAHYGSTSAGGSSRAPLIMADTEQIVYEPCAPFIRYNIVNPETMADCAEGERGRVVVSHLTPYAFYPHIIERDTALKCAPPPDALMGSRIADVRPDREQGGKRLIEGVY